VIILARLVLKALLNVPAVMSQVCYKVQIVLINVLMDIMVPTEYANNVAAIALLVLELHLLVTAVLVLRSYKIPHALIHVSQDITLIMEYVSNVAVIVPHVKMQLKNVPAVNCLNS